MSGRGVGFLIIVIVALYLLINEYKREDVR